MALTIRTVVRDPVHGDIGLTREELAILDTPQMQRLRGVRQLGTAYLVYPGAQHTRFEHSLGTMHLVQAMVEAINRNRALAPGELIGVADDELRILRAAALVHDLTHIPFGHWHHPRWPPPCRRRADPAGRTRSNPRGAG